VTIIAVIALMSGLAALTAMAVFVYFGAYWRMVWRQNRRENNELLLANPSTSTR